MSFGLGNLGLRLWMVLDCVIENLSSRVSTHTEQQQVVLYPTRGPQAVARHPEPDFHAAPPRLPQFPFRPYPSFVAQIPPCRAAPRSSQPASRQGRPSLAGSIWFSIQLLSCVIFLEAARGPVAACGSTTRTCVRRGFYGSPKVDRMDRMESVGS